MNKFLDIMNNFLGKRGSHNFYFEYVVFYLHKNKHTHTHTHTHTHICIYKTMAIFSMLLVLWRSWLVSLLIMSCTVIEGIQIRRTRMRNGHENYQPAIPGSHGLRGRDQCSAGATSWGATLSCFGNGSHDWSRS